MTTQLLNCDKRQLWQGCIWGGIANAVMTADSPLYSSFRRWDAQKYILNNHLSTQEGVIVFEEGWHSSDGWLIGLFYDSNSDNGPYRNTHYQLDSFLRGIPSELMSIAHEAIDRHLLRHKTTENPEIAFVTGVIWSTGETIQASVSLQELMSNGMSVIRNELLGVNDSASVAWRSEYNMSSDQFDCILRLFEMRMAQLKNDIFLDDSTIQQLERLSSSQDALDKCEGLLDALGFLFGPPITSSANSPSRVDDRR